MPLKSRIYDTAGTYIFSPPDGVTAGWISMVGATMGGMGQYQAVSDQPALAGTGGGAAEVAFNLPIAFSDSVSVIIGSGGAGGHMNFADPLYSQNGVAPGPGGPTSCGQYSVAASTGEEVTSYVLNNYQPYGTIFGYNGGGVTGGIEVSGFPDGARASVGYFGGGCGGDFSLDGTGSAGYLTGAPAGSATDPNSRGGGGAVTPFGTYNQSGNGGDGNNVGLDFSPPQPYDGHDSTTIGTGGGGGGINARSVSACTTTGGKGKDGWVAIFWIAP
jgi:hypothetical protein